MLVKTPLLIDHLLGPGSLAVVFTICELVVEAIGDLVAVDSAGVVDFVGVITEPDVDWTEIPDEVVDAAWVGGVVVTIATHFKQQSPSNCTFEEKRFIGTSQ